MSEKRQFQQMQVSELFCPHCKQARPVRRHLLLVLPDGNRYEFRCQVCGTGVGEEKDSDRSEFQSILAGS